MPESPFSNPPTAEDAAFETPEDAAGDAMDTLRKAADALNGHVEGDHRTTLQKKPSAQMKEQPDFGVTPDVKEAYVRSLLSGEPFKAGFELFRGNVSITFRSRTIRETKWARRAAELMTEPGDGARWACLLAYSIDEVVIGDTRVDRAQLVSNDGVDLTTLYDLPDVVYYAILSKFREFEDMCDDLFRKADSPDF